MTLSDLAAFGSFVSGVAVLASLVFLFFQMRQMTEQVRQTERNQRSLMNQGITNRVNDMLRWLSEPYMADLMSRVEAGETEFTRKELYQLKMYLRAAVSSTRDVYNQHQAGLADKAMLDSAFGSIRAMLSKPVFRALWTRDAATPGWREYIDKLVADVRVAEPVDLVVQFKADLAEVVVKPETKAAPLLGNGTQ